MGRGRRFLRPPLIEDQSELDDPDTERPLALAPKYREVLSYGCVD
jgi:hypothetical protein